MDNEVKRAIAGDLGWVLILGKGKRSTASVYTLEEVLRLPALSKDPENMSTWARIALATSGKGIYYEQFEPDPAPESLYGEKWKVVSKHPKGIVLWKKI